MHKYSSLGKLRCLLYCKLESHLLTDQVEFRACTKRLPAGMSFEMIHANSYLKKGCAHTNYLLKEGEHIELIPVNT